MAGQAKDLRDEWEIKLLTDVEELNVAAAATPANARVIEGKIKKVESTFERLGIVHAQYCQKAKIGLGSSDSAEFMSGQVKMKLKSVTAAREALGEDDEEEKLRRMLMLHRMNSSNFKWTLKGKLLHWPV